MKWSRFNVLFSSNRLGKILFNTRTLSLSKISEETFLVLERIRDGLEDPHQVLLAEDIERLRKSKVLVENHEDIDYLNFLKYKKNLESYCNKKLGLVVCPTLSCNFACPYCYEHNHSCKAMSAIVQDSLINFANKHSAGCTGATLNWHGGEPLVAFGTIREFWDKLETRLKLPVIHSSMVSNGYLLTEEMCQYFNEKGLDYLQITIDGTKETHDKTRILKSGGSTYDRIIANIDMATELMPKCQIGVRTNIWKGNKAEYLELYKELSSRWKTKNCNIYHAYVLENELGSDSQHRLEIELSEKEKMILKSCWQRPELKA